MNSHFIWSMSKNLGSKKLLITKIWENCLEIYSVKLESRLTMSMIGRYLKMRKSFEQTRILYYTKSWKYQVQIFFSVNRIYSLQSSIHKLFLEIIKIFFLGFDILFESVEEWLINQVAVFVAEIEVLFKIINIIDF